MKPVRMRVGAQPVVLSRPDGSECGRLAVGMLATLAKAHATRAAAAFLEPATLANEALFALIPEEVARIPLDGTHRTRARVRWEAAQMAETGSASLADATASFWLEWCRELRRHVGDDRLPIDVRGRLRDAAHRSFRRSQRRALPLRFPRTLLRDRFTVRLPEPLADAARTEAAARGINDGRPQVAIDLRVRRDLLRPAFDFLAGEGYTVVSLGGSPALDVWLLLTCEFLICDTSNAQRAAYLTNTRTLTIGATDAYTFYPVRSDGIFLLKRAVDLDSGSPLRHIDLLGASYYRRQRNCGFREHDAGEILAAVEEMVHGVRGGWQDSDGQARFRARAIDEGMGLAPRIPHIAKWGPVDGFIGDGRLARVQADDEASGEP